MQYKIPQNIDMEDKIIGPLTLIQFLYVLAGGVVDYLLLIAFKGGWVWALVIPIGLFALALAFIKIQDQPLSHFVKAGIIYLGRPKIRLWHRQGLAIEIVKAKPKKIKKAAPSPPKRKIEKSELEKLAYMLDTHPAGQIQQGK